MPYLHSMNFMDMTAKFKDPEYGDCTLEFILNDEKVESGCDQPVEPYMVVFKVRGEVNYMELLDMNVTLHNLDSVTEEMNMEAGYRRNHAFYGGDVVRILPDPIIKKELHGAKGIVIRWAVGKVYIVQINTVEYAISEQEMELWRE